MKRIIKIFFANYKFCFLRIFEFRAEVLGWTFTSLLWSFLALFTIDLMFGQIDSIAGWTKNEMMILSVVGSMFNSLMWFWIIPSMLYLGEQIRKGGLDFYLLKPVNSHFLTSISRFEFDNYLRSVVMVYILFCFIPINLNYLGFIILILCGLVIFYGLFSIITTFGLWFVGDEGLENLFDSIVVMGRYPTNIFEGGMRAIFYFIIPMAFVATFPVQVLLGKAGSNLVFIGILIATIFLVVSNLFWNFALKHYSSASS